MSPFPATPQQGFQSSQGLETLSWQMPLLGRACLTRGIEAPACSATLLTWPMSLRASPSLPASSSSRAAATQPGAWRGLVEITLLSRVRARLMSPISASLDTCTQSLWGNCLKIAHELRLVAI